MDLVSLVFLLLAYLAPVALPAIALVFSMKSRFWWRIVFAVVASLLSLPIGFVLMLLAHYPALFSLDHINPGMGLAAYPVLIVWAISFFTIMVVVLFVIARRGVNFWIAQKKRS